MTLIKKSKGIYLDDSCIDLLNDIDTIIFDCDGVLIDITKSMTWQSLKQHNMF